LAVRGIDPAEIPDRYRAILTRNPFFDYFDPEVVTLERGHVVLRFPFHAEMTQYQGAVQGGIVVAYADASLAFATASVVAESRDFVTTELAVQYVRSLTAGAATATAVIEHAGRTLVRGRAKVENESGQLIALCISTFMVVDPRARS
jgi:uncharacterized protein (TIGR00369 family)